MSVPRVAVVTSHPVQYYAPWFRHLAGSGHLSLKVFYLWDGGVSERFDAGFAQKIRWDVPLLDGYESEFVPNTSSRPGVGQFSGLRNPTLLRRLAAFDPKAALLIGYNYASFLRLIFAGWPRSSLIPLIFRGDSHRLYPRPDTLRERLRHAMISTVYRRFTAFLYVGQANLAYFRAHGVPPERLFFAPHAVDNERFSADPQETARAAGDWRQALGIPDDRALILFAGKFEDKKRPQDLLQAFQRLGTGHRAALLFVGGGALENELRTRAAETAHVYFAPFQNQTRMPRTYAAADVFVLPSFGPGETWGLAINEALCLGKPVIVSSHVGCATDLVEPHENGLVFAAGDVDELTASLREALSDRARLSRWGETGRKIAARYNYTRASEGLMEALRSIHPR